MIALLADTGYVAVEHSHLAIGTPDEPERRQAAFPGPGLPLCTIDVDSRALSNRFAIAEEGGASESVVVDDVDPFALENKTAGQDRRIAPVVRLIRSFGDEDGRWNRLYAATQALWDEVEARTGRADVARALTVSKT